MGDMGDMFRALKDHRKDMKERYGVPCPDCKKRLPKAHPKILMPGQKCWCGYRDPRDIEVEVP
jgi:hypothetical protein